MAQAKIPIPLLVMGGLSFIAVTGFVLYFDPGGVIGGRATGPVATTLSIRTVRSTGEAIRGVLVVATPIGQGSRTSFPASDPTGRAVAGLRPGKYALSVTPKQLTTKEALLEFFAANGGDTRALDAARIAVGTVEIGSAVGVSRDVVVPEEAGY